MARSVAEHSNIVPVSVALLALLGAVGSQPTAVADPLPYGPDTCIQGYVWRDARPGDRVCVTPATRDATAQQNAVAAQNVQPGGGAYGPNTCKQGFVWREAFGGDQVCVTPAVRGQAGSDNSASQSRYQRNKPNPPANPPPPVPPEAPPLPVDRGGNPTRGADDYGNPCYSVGDLAEGRYNDLCFVTAEP